MRHMEGLDFGPNFDIRMARKSEREAEQRGLRMPYPPPARLALRLSPEEISAKIASIDAELAEILIDLADAQSVITHSELKRRKAELLLARAERGLIR